MKKLLLLWFLLVSINSIAQVPDTPKKEVDTPKKEIDKDKYYDFRDVNEETADKIVADSIAAEKIAADKIAAKRVADSIAAEKIAAAKRVAQDEMSDLLIQKNRLEEEIRQRKIKEILVNGTKEEQEAILAIQQEEKEKLILANTVKTYNASILNTNFNIPLARFNFTTEDNTVDPVTGVANKSKKKGDIILFNSIGAGFGYSWGELRVTRDNKGDAIDEDFTNIIGVSFGFLFSAGTGEDTKNVFAPVANLAILDFQLGLGYELGTRSEFQKNTFLSLSYSIPLYKLNRTKLWIIKRTEKTSIDSGNGSVGPKSGSNNTGGESPTPVIKRSKSYLISK